MQHRWVLCRMQTSCGHLDISVWFFGRKASYLHDCRFYSVKNETWTSSKTFSICRSCLSRTTLSHQMSKGLTAFHSSVWGLAVGAEQWAASILWPTSPPTCKNPACLEIPVLLLPQKEEEGSRWQCTSTTRFTSHYRSHREKERMCICLSTRLPSHCPSNGIIIVYYSLNLVNKTRLDI